MRTIKPILLPLLASLLVAPSAFGEDKPAKKKDDSSEKSDKAEKGGKAGKSSDGVRRDPKNITGISPFMEKLAKGHKQVAARDFPGAIESYRAAITEEDKNPQGHLFLAETQVIKGDLNEADASFQTGMRTGGPDENAHAKLAFGVADLRERQGKMDDAKAAWAEYGKYVAEHPKAKGYPTTPVERQKVIDAHNDLEKKYAEVRKRIAARDKELKDKQAADAAKDAAEEEKKSKGKKK